MNKQVTLIHYGELSLKGKNRNLFENKLVENIENKTGGVVKKYRGRFILNGGNPDKLKYIFGISWFAEAYIVDRSIHKITKFVLESTENIIKDTHSFAVFVNRADKNFPCNSMDLESIIGQSVSEKYNSKVNLSNPDFSIFIEIAEDVFVYYDKKQGQKGLPVDVSGSVLSLLSGGIDSPVSSYLMMKRGCRVNFIHFHVFRENKSVLNSKIHNVIEILNKYQENALIFLVPYFLFEMSVLKISDTRGYETVLFRKYMIKVAERIALENRFKAIVTGDSIGQVASQTIENISQVMTNVSMPLFQPLITYDKQEIIDLAKQIGTYDISIKNYKDCCSLISRNPRTRTNARKLNELEKGMDLEKLVEESVGMTSIVEA